MKFYTLRKHKKLSFISPKETHEESQEMCLVCILHFDICVRRTVALWANDVRRSFQEVRIIWNENQSEVVLELENTRNSIQ